ncbi:pseudouridine synthase [Helcococcus sueciensis]|uniref:pseudouridine synthase n=1 Tax=Helcococcus sueciensis TaxID=241555 RepID=UPI000425CC38|nr:pseudouridine synthase [Helcococcus sueciensis]
MRINKYIAKCGITSRRKADTLIEQGKISVNDKVMTSLGYIVQEDDVVKYEGKIIKLIEDKHYIMLNKPIGYTCTNSKNFDDKVIFDLIDIDTKLFSIGRLDKDSRGLILITNDGDIYNNVVHPRNEIFKKYIVKLDKSFLHSDKYKIESGIDIGDYITNPSRIKILGKNILQIEINEGKNRQIRRMFDVLNYEVIDLNRVSIGDIKLGELPIGSYRVLSNKEVNYLRNL